MRDPFKIILNKFVVLYFPFWLFKNRSKYSFLFVSFFKLINKLPYFCFPLEECAFFVFNVRSSFVRI